MRLVDRYILPPGCCRLCRCQQRPDEEAVVDTLVTATDGIYEDGRVYICRACCVDLAMLWRFSPPELVDRFVAERDAAIRQVTALRDELAALEAIRDAIEVFRPAPEVELVASGRYTCPECGESKQNPQGLGRHMQAKHNAPYSAIFRGDAALDTQPVDEPVDEEILT